MTGIISYTVTNSYAKWNSSYTSNNTLKLSVKLPNIDKSGSVIGMKNLGYWDRSDRIAQSHGWKYNIDRFVCDKNDKLEMIVANECMCQGCIERRQRYGKTNILLA